MGARSAFVPVAALIEAMTHARDRAETSQPMLRNLRLRVDVPVVVEVRGHVTFVRFLDASEARTTSARLQLVIGPSGTPPVAAVSPPGRRRAGKNSGRRGG